MNTEIKQIVVRVYITLQIITLLSNLASYNDHINTKNYNVYYLFNSINLIIKQFIVALLFETNQKLSGTGLALNRTTKLI